MADVAICRQCARLHPLTDAEQAARKVSPIVYVCPCGARYQFTRNEIRWIERAPQLELPK